MGADMACHELADRHFPMTVCGGLPNAMRFLSVRILHMVGLSWHNLIQLCHLCRQGAGGRGVFER